jgi:hypothetical protein
LLTWGLSRIHVLKRKKLLKFLVPALIIAIAAAAYVALEKREAGRSKSYGKVVEFIENNINPGETIGYVYSHRIYLLYGKALNRKAVYIPAGDKSFSQWLEMLRKEKIRMVAVGPYPKNWEPQLELSWLTNPFGTIYPGLGKKSRKEITI